MNKRELRKFREAYSPWKSGEIISDRVKLAVHFDEKEWVKGLGAQWNPDPSGKGGYWSMAESRLSRMVDRGTYTIINIFEDADDESASSMTILEWLNANRMIEECEGKIDPKLAEALALDDTVQETYVLTTPWNPASHAGSEISTVNFEVYEWTAGTVIRQCHPEHQGHAGVSSHENWYWLERGREAWDELIASGYLPKKMEVSS